MFTFGIEIETSGQSITEIKNALRHNEINGCIVKPDGTPNVDCEIVLPPLSVCDFSFDYIKKVCRVLKTLVAELTDNVVCTFTSQTLKRYETTQQI